MTPPEPAAEPRPTDIPANAAGGISRAQAWIIVTLLAMAVLGVWAIVIGDAVYLWDWFGTDDDEMPRRYYDSCDPATDCPADFGWFSPGPAPDRS